MKASFSCNAILLLGGALLAILTAFVYPPQKYLDDLNQARQRISSENSKVVETACGLIEYAEAGPKNGSVVLVVHGASGGFDQGLYIGRDLIEKGFRVIAPSRFGYIRTPLPEEGNLSVQSQAEAYACLLDTLEITDPVGVFGVSAGSVSSLKFAHLYPERTNALIVSVPGSLSIVDPNTQKAYFQLPPGIIPLSLIGVFSVDFVFWAIRAMAPELLIRSALGTPVSVYRTASAPDKARIDEMLDTLLPTGVHSEGSNVEFTLMQEPTDFLSEIRTPTLTISYQDDLYGSYGNARTIAERIPGARFLGYPDGGHMGVGHAEEYNLEISNFFQQHIALSS